MGVKITEAISRERSNFGVEWQFWGLERDGRGCLRMSYDRPCGKRGQVKSGNEQLRKTKEAHQVSEWRAVRRMPSISAHVIAVM
jgi:hypothetical protein